jgi:hypothetical protein
MTLHIAMHSYRTVTKLDSLTEPLGPIQIRFVYSAVTGKAKLKMSDSTKTAYAISINAASSTHIQESRVSLLFITKCYRRGHRHHQVLFWHDVVVSIDLAQKGK